MEHKTTYLDNNILYRAMRLLYSDTDSLVDRLAPEGWANSPYHFPFEVVDGEREALYQSYDTVAAAYKGKFGPLSQQYISKNRYEIDFTTQASNSFSAETELIYLIEYAILQLSTNGLFFKAGAPYSYYLIDDLDLEEQSYLLGIELDLDIIMTPEAFRPTAARADILLYIDLSVLYAFIIGAFCTQGIDWRYRNDELSGLWINHKIATRMQKTSDKPKKRNLLEILNQLLTEIENGLPPDEVIGYCLTYDRLPLGYPPTIEDIKALNQYDFDL
ncbi:hypothetical protein CLV99_1195 [Sphingobacterium yanglingense]|uniref:Uncharacterized protein n=2 Tax=Sphingobacterium yanglingense TaxID=1437280 RepID=A0A4R6WL93_9SPHI|nr:hypothetical protein CLV99_1195 [Sphingobacterium yanglingense]